MSNELSAYAGAKSKPIIFSGDGGKFELVYNDTGAQLDNGSIVIVSEVKSGTAGNSPCALACATTTVAVKVGVVNNGILNASGIPSASWGYVQTDGYCPKVKTPGSTAAERYLAATNATQVATDVAAANADGVTGVTAKSFAVSKSAESGGFQTALLRGLLVTI